MLPLKEALIIYCNIAELYSYITLIFGLTPNIQKYNYLREISGLYKRHILSYIPIYYSYFSKIFIFKITYKYCSIHKTKENILNTPKSNPPYPKLLKNGIMNLYNGIREQERM